MAPTPFQREVERFHDWWRSTLHEGRDPLDAFPLPMERFIEEYADYHVESVSRLRGPGGARYVAEMDRQSRTIWLSNEFQENRNWTLAHELKHIVLDEDIQVAHRDVPGDVSVGRSGVRTQPLRERQANAFAAAILMPRPFVAGYFLEAFGRESISLRDIDDRAASELFLSAANWQDGSYAWAEVDVDALCLAVSRTQSWRGRGFRSLRSKFGVSATVMAIQLREQKLIRKDPDDTNDSWRLAFE